MVSAGRTHARRHIVFNTRSVGIQCTRAAAVTFTEKYCSSMWLYDFLINPLRSIKNSQALVYMFSHILSPRGQNTAHLSSCSNMENEIFVNKLALCRVKMRFPPGGILRMKITHGDCV